MNQQQRAVVQQALEALELNNQEWKELADSGDCGFWKAEDQDHYKQASASITALRQMLEHPEQGEVVVKSNGHVSPLLTHMMNRRTKAEAQPVQEPVSFDDWPEYHEHAMGCGLEDRGITDRYEAMRYGWDEALERAWEAVNLLGPLYTTPPAQPADEPDRLLLAAMDLARQQHSRIEELEALLAKAQPAPVHEPVACLSETQAKAILNLALHLETTGRCVAITEGQERADFVAINQNTQYALEDALRNATTPPAAQPADHSEQHLDMVDHADELTIAYMSGVYDGKKMAKRECVGLTIDELIALEGKHRSHEDLSAALKAKLREKNGGGA